MSRQLAKDSRKDIPLLCTACRCPQESMLWDAHVARHCSRGGCRSQDSFSRTLGINNPLLCASETKHASATCRCPQSSCYGTPEYPGIAVGDAACFNGTHGPVCAVCNENYYLFSGSCQCAPGFYHASNAIFLSITEYQ